jgi:hypothetical protein
MKAKTPTLKATPPEVVKNTNPEHNINVIRSLQDLLYQDTSYSAYNVSIPYNRLGLNDDEQQIIKDKLIEYINKL